MHQPQGQREKRRWLWLSGRGSGGASTNGVKVGECSVEDGRLVQVVAVLFPENGFVNAFTDDFFQQCR
jgi:hypothetical protein